MHRIVIIAAALLLALAAPCLAAAPPSARIEAPPNLQDYRLDQLEKRLDKQREKYGESLSEKTQDLERWVGSAQQYVNAQLTWVTIILAVIAVLTAMASWGIGSKFKSQFEQDRKMYMKESDSIIQDIKEIAESCTSMRRNIESDYKKINELSEKIEIRNDLSRKDMETIDDVAVDKEAPFDIRLNALFFKAVDGKQWEDALAFAEVRTIQNPNDILALYHKGVVLGNLNRHKESLDTLNKALQIDPNNHYIWCMKGSTLESMRQYKEALHASEKAIQLKYDNSHAWVLKGLILAHLGRYTEALDTLSTAIQIDPANIMAWNAKGITLTALEHYEDALQAYDIAIQLNGNDADIWANKGTTLGKLGRYDEALSAHDKACRLDINTADYVSARAYTISRQALCTTGKEQTALLEQAESEFKRAEQLKHGVSYYTRACIAALSGNKKVCKEWLILALENDAKLYCVDLKFDSDLDFVREETWFQDILEKTCAKEAQQG